MLDKIVALVEAVTKLLTTINEFNVFHALFCLTMLYLVWRIVEAVKRKSADAK